MEVGLLSDQLITSLLMKCTSEAAVASRVTLATRGDLWLEGCTGDKPAQTLKSSVSPPEVPVQDLPSKTGMEQGEGDFFLGLAGMCDITDESWGSQALAFSG